MEFCVILKVESLMCEVVDNVKTESCSFITLFPWRRIVEKPSVWKRNIDHQKYNIFSCNTFLDRINQIYDCVKSFR